MALGWCVHSSGKPASSSMLSNQGTAVVSQSIPTLKNKKELNADHFVFAEGNKGGEIGVSYFTLTGQRR